MDDREWLAERFEANRGHLRAVAYQMLCSPSEVDDAVQEAWPRLSRSDANGIENLRVGQPFSVMAFTIKADKIVEIDVLGDPARLRKLNLTIRNG